MKIKDLIKKLSEFDEELHVEIRYINECADEGRNEQHEDIEVVELIDNGRYKYVTVGEEK